jgi:hypothetical protein
MKQLYILYENYNEMKTRSQTREPRFQAHSARPSGEALTEPLLKKMGVPLPLLLPSGEGAAARSNRTGGFVPVLRHFFQKWVCAIFGKRGFTGARPRGLDVNIDFDLASKAWRANKKYMGDGSFKYIRNKYKENAQFRSRLHTRALDY